MRGRPLVTASVVTLMGFISASMFPVPAHADTSDCPVDFVCMWEDPDYSGSMYVYQPGNIGSYNIDGWNGDNEISSVYNHTNNCVRLYDNDNYTGTSYFIRYNTMLPNLAQNGYDNEAESFKILAC